MHELTANTISYDSLQPRKVEGIENFRDFKCSKHEFEEYLQVTATYDQNAQMRQTYVFMYNGVIVGYVALAMSDVPAKEQKRLNIDTYGTVPALWISHLATHKQYERRGIGRNMILWAIKYARIMSKRIGCRVVLVNSQTDVVDFYKKNGFVYALSKNQKFHFLQKFCSKIKLVRNSKIDSQTMYFDIDDTPKPEIS